MTFTVIDNKTGVEADKELIGRERWVTRAISPDAFILTESGELLLAFDDGRAVECPPGRFTVVVGG